jgi:hypothetical protein
VTAGTSWSISPVSGTVDTRSGSADGRIGMRELWMCGAARGFGSGGRSAVVRTGRLGSAAEEFDEFCGGCGQGLAAAGEEAEGRERLAECNGEAREEFGGQLVSNDCFRKYCNGIALEDDEQGRAC